MSLLTHILILIVGILLGIYLGYRQNQREHLTHALKMQGLINIMLRYFIKTSHDIGSDYATVVLLDIHKHSSPEQRETIEEVFKLTTFKPKHKINLN